MRATLTETCLDLLFGDFKMEFSPSPPYISFLLALGRILISLVSQQKLPDGGL